MNEDLNDLYGGLLGCPFCGKKPEQFLLAFRCKGHTDWHSQRDWNRRISDQKIYIGYTIVKENQGIIKTIWNQILKLIH